MMDIWWIFDITKYNERREDINNYLGIKMIEPVTFASQMLLFIANEIKTRNGKLAKISGDFKGMAKSWKKI